MIYALAGLNILVMLPVESLWVERSIYIEKTERHAAQAPALRERYHKSSVVNLQSSIPAYPGWD
jgi:hypothetical protein